MSKSFETSQVQVPSRDYSQEDFLKLVEGSVSAENVSPESLECIRKICRLLPVLSVGCFETWLAKDCERVDFNVCINPRINEHVAMSRWLEAEDKESLKTPIYSRITAFCKLWAAPDFYLRPFLGELWLVYDIINPRADLPQPWLYLSFLPNFLDASPQPKADMVIQGLRILYPNIGQDLVAKYAQVLAEIPPVVRLSALGFQETRTGNKLRIYVVAEKPEDLMATLNELNWSGDYEWLADEIARWSGFSKFYGLAMDFDDMLASTIGVEYHFKDDSESVRREFLGKLIEEELVDKSKEASFLSWEQDRLVPTDAQFWSWPSKILSGKAGMPESTIIRQKTPYIKMLYDAGKAPVTKGYFFFTRPILNSLS